MESFYICVILVGIFIVVFSLICMTVEKKKKRDYRRDIDERISELQQVIQDADQLLTELNNYSTYIVERIEEKQQNLENVAKKIDERIEYLQLIENPNGFAGNSVKSENSDSFRNYEETVAAEKISSEQWNSSDSVTHDFTPDSDSDSDLASLDDRRREVIRLFRKGISSTEIAKMLNMGKGEIELITHMYK